VRDISVAAQRRGSRLDLRFVVRGNAAGLAVPQKLMPARADRLWQHTCFEAFVGIPDRENYIEFNLAPSGLWAAYAFTRPREGMADVDGNAVIPLEMASDAERLELSATLDLSPVPEFAAAPRWRCNLSAVIEERSGRKSYWALSHPPGRPDFHCRDCFVLELPAA